MSELAHLARRFVGSLSRRPPGVDDARWAESFLLPIEAAMWRKMSTVDRRHHLLVARRFLAERPDATRAEMAGALLHDVGKVESGLGTFGRVIATIVGPRTERFRAYHDHEAIGARWLADAGSDPATIAVVRREGPAAAALAAADDV